MKFFVLLAAFSTAISAATLPFVTTSDALQMKVCNRICASEQEHLNCEAESFADQSGVCSSIGYYPGKS